MSERLLSSEPINPKEHWTEEDLEKIFQGFALVRQESIRRHSEDFKAYLALSRWGKFKDGFNFGGLTRKARYYLGWPGFWSIDSGTLPTSISLGDRWKKNIQPIAQDTSRDGKERVFFATYDANSLNFTQGPIGNKNYTRGIAIAEAVRQLEIDNKKTIVAFGHTHPLPEHNPVAQRMYNIPASLALFSPGDLSLITQRTLTPFWFVVSGNEVILGINNSRTSEIDGEIEFSKEIPGIPDDAFKDETLWDQLRYIRYANIARRSNAGSHFDLLNWNVGMAKKANLALYRGSFERLDRLV